MESMMENVFRFENDVLVKARAIDEKSFTERLMTKYLSWAIYNDMLWDQPQFGARLAQILPDRTTAPSTRLFSALMDNARLSRGKLEEFLQVYKRHKGDALINEFQLCIAQRELLRQTLLESHNVEVMKRETLFKPIRKLYRRGLALNRKIPENALELYLMLIDITDKEDLLEVSIKVLESPELSIDDQYKVVLYVFDRMSCTKERQEILTNFEQYLCK